MNCFYNFFISMDNNKVKVDLQLSQKKNWSNNIIKFSIQKLL